MRRVFGSAGVSWPRKVVILLTGVAALALAGGIAYAASNGGGVINACAKTEAGQLRLDTGGGCLPSEQAVQWNQTGPQGPPGNTDSTVRHINNFMFDGSTVSTPILAANGELGTLSLLCGSDAKGGNGEITYTQGNNTGSFQHRIIFYSPEISSSPTVQIVNGHVTFRWGGTPGNSILFEIMIEGLTAEDPAAKPLLTDIHGFIQHFDFGGGACSYYVHVDTADIASPEIFTP